MAFNSHAADYAENALDLNKLLISHRAATYFMRMNGNAWEEDGIRNGDILVVDRAALPAPQRLVVISTENGLKLQRRILPRQTLWGIVTAVIRKL